MTVKNALKKKNKLVQQCNFYFGQLERFNSVDVENANRRAYDPRESMKQWLNQVNELIILKTRIQKTNMEIYEKVVRMAELKGLVSKMRSLECTEGRVIRGYDKEHHVTYTSVITLKEKDEMMQQWEDEIGRLQDELDEFNQQTHLVN